MSLSTEATPNGRGAPRTSGAALPAAYAVPALFVVENVLGSPLGTYAGVPVRLALFAASLSVLAWLAAARAAFPRDVMVPALAVLAFLAWQVLWATLVPAAAGTELPYTFAEFRPFLLLSAPVLCAAAAPTRRSLQAILRALQRLVVRAALVLAAIQVVIWVLATAMPQFQAYVFFALAVAFPDARSFLYVGPMPDGFFRVFWISSLWVAVAWFWTPVVVRGAGRLLAARLLLLAAVFVSYSRGIWLGMAVGTVAAAALLVGRLRLRQLLRRGLAGVAATVIAGVLLVTTEQGDRALARVSISATRSGPEDERVTQIAPLRRVWERAPLLGVGYGGYAPDYIRVPTAPYSYENTGYALLAKLGGVGLAGSALAVALWLGTAWHARRRAGAEAPAFAASLLTLLVASLTNPLLINFVGMTVLACLLLQWITLAASLVGDGRAGPAAGPFVVAPSDPLAIEGVS